MKKQHTLRSLLISISLVIAMGMGTAVFATEGESVEGIQSEEIPVDEALLEELPDSDELLEGYMELQTENALGNGSNAKSTRGARFTGLEKTIYDIVSQEIRKISEGQEEDTDIVLDITPYGKTTFTARELGVEELVKDGKITREAVMRSVEMAGIKFDFDRIFAALLVDMPYDLYWMDKTSYDGFYYDNIDIIKVEEEGVEVDALDLRALQVEIPMYVELEYCKNPENRLLIDREKTQAPKNAAQSAAMIVSQADGLTDAKRLNYYREKICDLVEYYEETPGEPYGNPWQMIWVFDGNDQTKVTCEGYSKAFKFLCDCSGFNNKNVECYIVSGTMDDGTGAGKHMWNLVHMEDGEEYMCDLTNCDEDSIGYPDVLFMRGCGNGTADGYTLSTTWRPVYFGYDKATISLYTAAERTLGKSNYGAPSIAQAKVTGLANKVYNGKAQAPAPTVKFNGVTLKKGTDYTVSYKNNKVVGKATVTITGINDYNGSMNKTFNINPKGTTLKKVTAVKKGFTAKWSKQATQTSGYQIQYCLKKNFKSKAKIVTVKGAKKITRKVTKLKAKKTYYVRVRTFKTVGSTKYYSTWSKVKKIKTKK